MGVQEKEKLEDFKRQLKRDIRRLTTTLAVLEDEPLAQNLPETRSKVSKQMKTRRKLPKATKDKISASQKKRWEKQKEASRAASRAA